MTHRSTPLSGRLPSGLRTARIWLHHNLFNTWYNVLLTLLCTWLLAIGLGQLLPWIFTEAQWAVVIVNHRLLMVGRYPVAQLWRVWMLLAGVVATVSVSWGVLYGWRWSAVRVIGLATVGALGAAGLLQTDQGSWVWLTGIGSLAGVGLGVGQRLPTVVPKGVLRWSLPLVWLLTFLGGVWLLVGGWGLTPVRTSAWNGLLQTLVMAVISIVLSFPLGVLLALGRRSDLPVIRTLCVVYIEVIRGVPLISILFMARFILPLLFPIQVQLDLAVRAIAGLTLFSAAYLAENVRGGLQSVPPGQTEAAQALGLSPLLTLGLIVLPQALRAVVPAIVGQCIGLLKDTSLLAYVGLIELTGMARSILAQPQFITDGVGRYGEVYLFIGLIYGLFCYLMSVGSRRLEQQL